MKSLPKFRVVKRRVIYQGHVIKVVRDTLAVEGQQVHRDVVLHPGAVAIVPFVDKRHLVFVRQYRHVVGRDLLELPAGTLDHRESPLSCAKRELEEETGYRATHWKRLTQFYCAPGVTSERMLLYVATNLRPGPARPEADEFLQLVILSIPEALAKIRSGQICDAKSIIGVWCAAGRFSGISNG